ncbi:unnamed protein product [Adineta steineri]|uniref:Uncharacterized protein n=1 Tax=Adineta steineri TaxID=433720 RepID=A0A814RMF4_9BILA|nr:unnamed protein product [Adineta steineri]
MERTIQYVQSNSNFDSVYNAPLNVVPTPPTYVPLSSVTYSTCTVRPSSPLFRRTTSPPPRPRALPEHGPKFNFDLYQMNPNTNEYDDFLLPSNRSISPTSSSIIYHYPTYSPLSSSTSTPPTLAKLRQINDELCHTLAQSELNDPPPPAQYHIHHYPLSQHLPPYQTYRTRPTYEERSSATELEVSPKLHKARVTYEIHMPETHRQERHQDYRSSHYSPPSDVSSNDSSMIIDLYPTRDQGFVKQKRKHTKNQSPWIVDGVSLRRDSYSDTSISQQYEMPKGLYYGDKPIKSHRRSVRIKERPSSNPHHISPYVSSRRLSSSNTRERIWQPPSKIISERRPKYFELTLKPEYDTTTRKRMSIDGTESEPISQRKTSPSRFRIRNGDPKLKRRIANAESKVKSAWKPTVTGLSQRTTKETKPPTPQFVKQTTINTPPKSKVKSVPSTPIKKVETAPSPPPPPITTTTGRHSPTDIPTEPIFESTPRNQSIVNKNDDSVMDLSDNESHISERSNKNELPHPPPPQTDKTPTPPPPQIDKIPTPPPPEQPRKPSVELPNSSQLEPEKETKSIIKDDASIIEKDKEDNPDTHHSSSAATDVNNTKDEDDDDDDDASDTHNVKPIPSSPKASTSGQKDNNNNTSVVDDDNDDDENDREVARSFDINNWLNDASKEIFGALKPGNTARPAQQAPAPAPVPKSNIKSPPRRKQQPPSPAESPDHNLYKPPFGPKKTEKKSAATPSPPPTNGAADVDDFFS